MNSKKSNFDIFTYIFQSNNCKDYLCEYSRLGSDLTSYWNWVLSLINTQETK